MSRGATECGCSDRMSCRHTLLAERGSRTKCPCYGRGPRTKCPCYGRGSRTKCPCYGRELRTECPRYGLLMDEGREHSSCWTCTTPDAVACCKSALSDSAASTCPCCCLPVRPRSRLGRKLASCSTWMAGR